MGFAVTAFWVRRWSNQWLCRATVAQPGRKACRQVARLGVQELEARDVPATITSASNVLSYTAGAGVSNGLTVSVSGSNLTFTDTAEAITTGLSGATGSGTNTVTVPGSGVTGVNLALADGTDTINAVTLGKQTLAASHTGGGLTLAGAVTTANADIVITSANGLTVASDINSGTATVSLAANTDGAGNEGFSQTGGTITATSTSNSAITVAVNTSGGGTGNASLDNVRASVSNTSGGRLTVGVNGGSIVYAPGTTLTDSQLGLTNGGSAPARVLMAREYAFTASGAGSIGANDRPIQAFNVGSDGAAGNSNATLNAGSGGVYFVKWNGIDLQLAGAKTSGNGDIRIVTANAAGDNFRVNGDISAANGNIYLASDDDFVVNGTSVIGGTGFSGTVFILANQDQGTAGQNLSFSADSSIVTSNTTNQANPDFFAPTTQAVYLQIAGDAGNPSNLRVANISTGAGGRVVLNAVPNGAASVAPGPEAGRVQMASAANVIDVGSTGDLRLVTGITAASAADAIGTAGVPVRVAGGRVEFDANLGNVYLSGATATSFAGNLTADTDGQTDSTGGAVELATESGVLTLTRSLNNINGGSVALRGAGGVVINSGVTLGGAGTGDILAVGGLSGTGGVAIGSGDLTIRQAVDSTFAGSISGAAVTKSLFKEGGGALTLSGTSTQAGVVVISAGELRLTGNLNGAGGVAVRDGGVLSGSGKVAGPVAVAGNLETGVGGVGQLASGNLSYSPGSLFVVDVADATSDRVNVTGAVTLDGKLRVALTGTPPVGTVYTIVANDGTDAVTGAFTNVANGGTVRPINATSYAFMLNTAGGDGNDVTLTLTSIDVFATGLLDVANGQLQYFAAAGVNNGLRVSLASGAYTIGDSAGAITLGSGAVAAGYTLSSGVATGPATGITTFAINLSDGTDSLGEFNAGSAAITLIGTNSLAINGAVTSSGAIGITDFARVGGPGSLSAANNVVISGGNSPNLTLGSVTVTSGTLTVQNATTINSLDANSVVSAGTLTLTADVGVGTSAAPLRTAATTLTVSAGGGGVAVAEQDGVDVTASATGAGSVVISNGSGTLNVASAITLTSGNISLSSGDGLTLAADLTTDAGTITLAANTDGAGNEGFDQKAATLTTGNESATALFFAVNTASGGTGDAVIGKGSVGSNTGGTVTANTFGGQVLWSNDPSYTAFTDSQTGLAFNGTNVQTLKAALYSLNGAGVGTSDRPIQIDNFGINGVNSTPQLSGVAGDRGFYVVGWDAAATRDLTAGDISVTGPGGIRVVSANAAGHNLYVTGTITGGSGVIHLAADDNLDIQPNAVIGGTGYSGSVYIQGNRDRGTGGQPVTFDKTASIVTSSTANQDIAVDSRTMTSQAVYIDIAGGNVTSPGIIQVANVTTGDGGRVVLNGVSPLSPTQSGLVRMADASNVINVGATGTTELIGTRIDTSGTAVNDVIGSASLPVRVAGGNVVVTANFGNAYVVGDGATKFTAVETAKVSGQTAAPTLSLATSSGLLTVSGPVANVNGGPVTLTGAGGVAIDSGATLGGSDTGAVGVNGGLSGTGTVSLGSGNLTVTQAVDSTFGGSVSGSKGVVKLGAGSLSLSGANSYTGATTVSAGTLALTGGSLTGAGAITTAAGATFGGSGSVVGAVTTSGTLSPGLAAAGKLSTGSLSFAAGSKFSADLNGTAAGTDYDQVSVTGTVNLTGAALDVRSSFTAPSGSTFVLIANDGTDAVTGQFLGAGGSPLAEGATVTINGQDFKLSYVGGDGNDVALAAVAVAGAPSVVGPVGINGDSAQRSRVTTLVVTFDQAVNLGAGAFTLTRIGLPGGGASNGVIPNSQVTVTLRAGTTATYDLTFTGTGLVQSGSLADGIYQLRVNASAVTAQSGGQAMANDFATPSTGANRIARLFGDVTGDGQVDFSDFLAFDQSNGLSSGDPGFLKPVDVNNDGQIDFSDFLAFDLNNGSAI